MSAEIIAKVLFLLYLLINAISFCVMFADKVKSKKKNSSRISEGMMFFLAVAFGSIGVSVGMLVFRHKTRKWYFRAGMPLTIMQNIMTLYAIYIILA